MAIFKGFKIQIVDGYLPNSNVIQEVGNVVISVVDKASTYTNKYFDATISFDVDVIEQFTNEQPSTGGAVIIPATPQYPDAYAVIVKLMPLTTLVSAGTLSSGQHVRAINNSGCYAIIDGSPSLYKADGTNIGTGLNFLLYANNNSVLSTCQLIGEYSGDTITSITNTISTSRRGADTVRFTSESASSNNANNTVTFLNLCEQWSPPPTDPYNGAGDSDTGGGDGTFDGSSDPVPVPSLPSIGATDTGFISLFVPSASQIRQVASYLWSSFFDLATFKKLFEDPMDCILGLSVVPVSVPTSGSAQITVGNIELSGISLPLASQQYVEVDCGTVDFTNRFFGSYLDFEPYTKMSLFVPYSGVHAVSADDIIGKVVGLKYHIDILTGSLVAFLTCGNSVLYEFNGACASNIPVNSMNYASTIENAIRIAVNIGTTVATAGAAAPLTGENAAARTAAKEFGTKVSIAGSTAEGALSLKPSIDRAGSLGGTTGLMGNQTPYFIITRPRMCKPKNQDVFQGYPSFIQTTLGDMEGTGFTAFENVILAGSYLTDTEKRELESILSAGVYL